MADDRTTDRPPQASEEGTARYRLHFWLILATAVLCLSAIVLRTPLRSRYWAWRIAAADTLEQRAGPLTRLAQAGNAGRWGVGLLLANEDPEIRQYGVLVLQHHTSAWARRKLVARLHDDDESVRELAALGLAILRDDLVVDELRRMYADGDERAATAACVALERLATPAAIAALTEMAAREATVPRRAALIDALAGIGQRRCVPALLTMLDDDRACVGQSRAARIVERIPLSAFVDSAMAVEKIAAPSRSNAETLSARAAAALSGLTGIEILYSSQLSAQQRDAAARRWRAWYEAQPDP